VLGLPCIIGKCAADGCAQTPSPDPWEGAKLTWRGCPAVVAMDDADVQDAMLVRGLSKLSPLSDWPDGYTGRIVMTWAEIESWRNEGVSDG
jgi:hypothetical protein